MLDSPFQQGGFVDIEFHAPGYRIIETPEMQTDDHGNRCYAIVDESSRVVWLFARTPGRIRQQVIAEALQQASRVTFRPVLSV